LAGFRPVKEDEMKYLSRTTVVLVFAVALSALPAHAAPSQRAHAAPTPQSVAARLSSAWTQLTHLFAATTGTTGGKGLSTDGGSCIDPNGCAQAQLFRH
jgi:hypothetical protein